MNWAIVAFLLAIAGIGHVAARRRAVRLAVRSRESSGPLLASPRLSATHNQYANFVALIGFVPALLLWVLWQQLEGVFLVRLALDGISGELQQKIMDMADHEKRLFFLMVDNHLAGIKMPNSPDQGAAELAERMAVIRDMSENIRLVVVPLVGLGVAFWALRRVRADFAAGLVLERLVGGLMRLCASLAVLITLGIVVALLVDALIFFGAVSPLDFFFGLHWSPQSSQQGAAVTFMSESTITRWSPQSSQQGAAVTFMGESTITHWSPQSSQQGAAEQEGFGAIPLFTGTMLITMIALVGAGCVGLMTAIYLSEYANERLRAVAKPALEILAGIPTVVYGLMAVTIVSPFLTWVGAWLGLSVSSESALSAGLVIGIMIIPLVSSLSDDVIRSVPNLLREASLGLGATRSETIIRVVLPAAAPGLFAALLLAASRAIGETMIVVMAAGLSANLTLNPLASTTTITVQIVTLLVGDTSFDSPKTLAAFGLGLSLLLVTLVMNLAAIWAARYFHGKYS